MWDYNESLLSVYCRKNFLQLDIFYKELSYSKIQQKKAFEFGSLLGEVGGFLGLLLGMYKQDEKPYFFCLSKTWFLKALNRMWYAFASKKFRFLQSSFRLTMLLTAWTKFIFKNNFMTFNLTLVIFLAVTSAFKVFSRSVKKLLTFFVW